MKYNSCFWPSGVETLDDGEEEMLELSCSRAGPEDGQTVLELGCGWLEDLDRRREEVADILATAQGDADVTIQLTRWRLFFMACEELSGFCGGREWGVAHYRFGI